MQFPLLSLGRGVRNVVPKASRARLWRHGVREQYWWCGAADYGTEVATKDWVWLGDEECCVPDPWVARLWELNAQVEVAAVAKADSSHGLSHAFHGSAIFTPCDIIVLRLHWRLPTLQLPHRSGAGFGYVT